MDELRCVVTGVVDLRSCVRSSSDGVTKARGKTYGYSELFLGVGSR